MNQFLLVTVLFTVAACATPGLDPNRSEADPVPEFAEASQPAQVPASVPAEQPRADEPVARNDAKAGASGIEEIEAPTVSKTAPPPMPAEPAIVCERVVPTGSILPTRVCRNRSQMERKQEADREIFDDIKRNTALGNSRL